MFNFILLLNEIFFQPLFKITLSLNLNKPPTSQICVLCSHFENTTMIVCLFRQKYLLPIKLARVSLANIELGYFDVEEWGVHLLDGTTR